MKNTRPLILLCLALLAPAAPVFAQSDIPLLLPEEQRAVERETAKAQGQQWPAQ